jgi:hypothetical protein
MRHRIGCRLGTVAIFASALIAVSTAVALAAPGASNAVTEHGSHSAMIIPNQPHHAGFGAVPAYSGASFHICLTSAPAYCLQSNGTGNQVTITSNKNNYSVFTKQYIDTGGDGAIFNVENGNGNCLRENNSHEVVIANGGCLSSDLDGRWNWYQIGVNYTGIWQNELYASQFMLVHGDVNGYKVWAVSPSSGDWIKWTPPG